MLLLGNVKTKRQARVLSTYLLSVTIANKIDQHEGHYELWIEKRECLEQAKEIYADFIADPDNIKFSNVEVVDHDRVKAQKLKSLYRKNFKRKYQRNYVTIGLMVVSVLVYLLMQSQYVNQCMFYLSIAPWGAQAFAFIKQNMSYFNQPGALASLQVPAIWLSQPWRLLSPMFLHFSIFHILFNMFWLYDLGSLIEQKEPAWFYPLLIVSASLLSNILQYVVDGPGFGGMSGVVYGLFAYIWLSAKFNPMSGYWIRQDIVVWMLGWFVLCFTGFLGPVANYGHLGGLLAGGLLAGLKRVL